MSGSFDFSDLSFTNVAVVSRVSITNIVFVEEELVLKRCGLALSLSVPVSASVSAFCS